MNTLAMLRDRFDTALAAMGIAEGERPELLAMVLPSQGAKHGDYQANVAMPLGKRLGKPPRDIAADLIRLVDVADMCEPPEIAGPGFINLRLKDNWLAEQVAAASSDVERIGVARAGQPRTVVVDFSGPNVAKPMHVGHIRSTVIGDALYRILKFLGHRTISDNHLGDWGTQFGMIIYGYKHFLNAKIFETTPVGELARLYAKVNSLIAFQDAQKRLPELVQRIETKKSELADLESQLPKSDIQDQKELKKRIEELTKALDSEHGEYKKLETISIIFNSSQSSVEESNGHPNLNEKVLAETALLHTGDPTNVELWRQFLPACLLEIEAVYNRIGVTFDHTLGESFYQDRLQGVVKDLAEKGLARESDGAICVFLEGYDIPMIVQKQDGAFLYATTDLATIQYRMREWRPDAILYVVDRRQSLHFEQLFKTAKLWGCGEVELQHVAFGTVLGEDGRPFKTRSGTSVGLAGLLDEAVERAYAIVVQNDEERPEPLLSEAERRTVAERVGIGAIKYADLSHNRTSDYVFSYDKMLAMNGNTATYMQNSYARVRSIFTKAGVDAQTLTRAGASSPPSVTSTPRGGEDAPARSNLFLLTTPHERALAVVLLQFSESLDRVAADYRPNHLAAYLFDLATRYSEFYENCPVLWAESDELRTSRLLLCDLTARTLERGLNLLGIDVVERM
jgi:arginyl-tRNA synthetase